MSEPITPEAATPATETAPESVGQEHLRRVEERHRVKAPVDQPPSVAAETATPTVPEPQFPSAKDIHPRFEERISRGRRLKDLEAQNREYAQFFRELAAAAGQADIAPPTPAELPDFIQNPQGWYDARLAQAEAKFEARLKPVLDFIQQQQGVYQQQQLISQRVQAGRQEMAERAEIMRDAETDYVATAEGQGYYERFDKFSRDRFARYKAAGHDDQIAAARVFRELNAHFEVAMEQGWNPAAYVDTLIRDGQGNAAVAAVSTTTASPVKTKEAVALRAAAGSGLAGSISQAGAPKSTAGPAVDSYRQAPSVKRLKELVAKDKSGSFKERLRNIQRRVLLEGE